MPLITETYPGAPGGSNVALPQHELDDAEARIVQDALLDYPALIRRRGPLTSAGLATLSHKASGMVVALTPLGIDRYAVLNGDASNGYFTVYSADYLSKVDLVWPHAMPANPPTQPYRIVDSKPALTGGAMVGVSSAYDSNSPSQGLAWWRGGLNATTSGNTISVSRGSAAVTGSGFNTNLSPGMWIFANTDEGYTGTFIGCVLQVNSDTSATLTANSPYNVTAKSATFQALRGIYPRIATGRITTDTNSTQVNGGKTKFQSQGLGSGSWQLYRANDMAYIGKVASVQTDIALTLTANAAIASVDEAYVALKADADWSIETTANSNKVGFLTANYAERQWYANNGAQFEKTYRVWFSEPGDAEAIDTTNDGDWLEINSTNVVNEPIRSLVPVYNSLVVLKESEAFAITGSGKESFAVKKIHDDGTLSGGSVQAYGGGAIWAGREGVHFYDGIQVQSLTANKLGDVWKNSVQTMDPSKYRMYSMIAREHYFLFVESLEPTLAIVKGNNSSTPNYWGICINLVTRSVVFTTNLKIRGAAQRPASSGASTWFVVNDSTKGIVCDAAHLFDTTGNDTITCEGATAGPDFFFETKKFSAGDALRLKRFKHIAMNYLAHGDALKVDTVLGLNNVGQTLSSEFPASVYTWDTLRTSLTTWDAVSNEFATWNDVINAVFVPKKIRFLKRSQFISFRVYQKTSNVTNLRLGPYGIGYKVMRPGRV